MLLHLVLLAALVAPPQRIISLAPSITEILFALGVGDRVVGVSSYCDYPPEATRIERIGTFLQPNVERILTKHPDLVIGVPSPDNRAPVERLETLGRRVLIVDPERVAATLAMVARYLHPDRMDADAPAPHPGSDVVRTPGMGETHHR